MAVLMPRLSVRGLMILKTLLDAPDEHHSGADIMRLTEFRSGTVYPILQRFQAAGILQSRWEAGNPKTLGRPLRHFYAFTKTGQRLAADALKEFSV